ncbi:uncharacterized protein A4U43_C06F12850 [Asparagus officinalis]|uniref:Uncharacterized protein n=1 Tax=Asparagus officinalis TaxID=4686 RepID=A0A5P1ENZ0_ASPOF|nr:uncharacterized protein A4U43_C06F12850 [Asparagus officinalis]
MTANILSLKLADSSLSLFLFGLYHSLVSSDKGFNIRTAVVASLEKKEQLWPELDQLLRDQDDVSGASTTYTAAVPEYKIVFVDSEATSHLEKKRSLANGHAVHDIHHPCSKTTLPPDMKQTGDHVGVYSENRIETAEEAEKLLGLSSDAFFSIHADNEDGTPRNGWIFSMDSCTSEEPPGGYGRVPFSQASTRSFLCSNSPLVAA